MAKLLGAMVNGALAAVGVPETIKQNIRGKVYDLERGHALYKRGIGKYYDSASTIARKGVSNPDRH